MKNKYVLLSLIYFLFLLPSNIEAQIWSSETVYSPTTSSTSILNNAATRIGYHLNNWSTYYMQYNDSSYFCSFHDVSLMSTLSPTYKIPMPQDILITYFGRARGYQGFVGSYKDTGMYGRTLGYNSTSYDNLIQIFRLSAVDCLQRFAARVTPLGDNWGNTKMLAVAEKARASNFPNQSFLVELYTDNPPYGPYFYAPLYYDHEVGEQEVADDVIIVDKYAVFATRDSRHNHAYVNLRIADTHHVLLGTDIDNQWQFHLLPHENVKGQIRLCYLEKDFFVMAYIVYDRARESHYLRVNKIVLSDFLSGNNTIETHERPLERGNYTLVDIIYDPVVQTMVILLNVDNRSELYQFNPFFSVGSLAFKLDYPHGNLYSLDTIRENAFTSPISMYVAAGGDRFFCQDISYGFAPTSSCLYFRLVDFPEINRPGIIRIYDPIECFTDNKAYVPYEKKAKYFEGLKSCVLQQNKNDIEDLK